MPSLSLHRWYAEDCLKEEEADAYDGYKGTYDGPPRDLLVEDPVGGQDNHNRCCRHQRRGDAGTSVLNGHQREAYTHKGTEDGGGCSHRQTFLVVHGLT